jgi:hypothetical protein
VRASVPAFTLATALALAAAPALAQQQQPQPQPPDGASDATRDQAREHFQRGVALINQARWQDAIVELEAARELRATPSVLFNLGLAQRAVGRNREASQSFRQFLEMTGAGGNAELRARAEDYIRDLNASMALLELRLDPTDAQVRVDGAELSERSRSVPIDPGRHVVTVQSPGYSTETRTVDLERSGTAVLSVRLLPLGMSAQLHVESNVHEAAIRVDDQLVGNGTADENVRPGHHTIEVRARGYSVFRRDYEAVINTHTNVRATLMDQRGVTSSPGFWVGTTLGTAAVAAGLTILGIVLFSTHDAPYRGSWGLVTDALTARGGQR